MKLCIQRIFFILSLLVLPPAVLAAPTLTFQVNGLDETTLKNVDTNLKGFQGLLKYPLTKEEIFNFYKNAPEKINEAIQPYGYFKATISSHLINNNGNYVAIFNIDPGLAIPITDMTLDIHGDGADDPAFQKMVEEFPNNLSKTLNTDAFNKTKADLFEKASHRGYFNAVIKKSQIIVNLKNYTAQTHIIFDTGKRYRFGETTLNKTPLSEKFLWKFIVYKQGEYYNFNKIERTQKNLSNSNYFAQVVISPNTDATQGDEVPISINLIPRNSRSYVFGAGYGTDTGIRGTIGATYRYLNRWGHSVHALLQASQYDNALFLNYVIPGPQPYKNKFIITGGLGTIEQSTGNSKNAKMSLAYATTFGDIKQTIALTYLDERYNLLGLPYTNANLFYPGISWAYRKTDKDISPNNGFTAEVDINGTSDSLTKDNRSGFTQFKLTAAALWTLFDSTRFLVRGELGRTLINNISNLPLSLQLFAGGAQSIRGFTYNSIGPGFNLAVGSVEIQQRIYKQLYLAAFVDAGNVTNGNPFIVDQLEASFGPAIMWLSPIGAIEISLPIRFNTKAVGFAFSMGPQI